MTPEETTVALAIVENVLTRLGIPAIFLVAWWRERQAHSESVRAHTRDLRRCAGLTIPEDVLQSDSGVGD